jgi:hypothetical protein
MSITLRRNGRACASLRVLALLMLSFVAGTLFSQEQPEFEGRTWKAPYTLPTPPGWAVERFPIPIMFAPEIPYKGVEDLRFAPGWSKVKSDEYWSYAFLWYLEGDVPMDPTTIGRNMKVYYEGLISSNGSAIPREQLIPVTTSFKEARTTKGDLKTYVGTIRMLDYMQKKPITLHCMVHVRSCPQDERTFIFHELSPQGSSHRIWKRLDQLWSGFKCGVK